MWQMTYLVAKTREGFKKDWPSKFFVAVLLVAYYFPVFKLIDAGVLAKDSLLQLGLTFSIMVGFVAYLALAYILGIGFPRSLKTLRNHLVTLVYGVISPVALFAWLVFFCRDGYYVNRV